jgi:cytochrome c oxidase subunit IV
MQPPVVAKSTYYMVAATLAVLLVLTVGAAQLDLGHFNTPIALAIAVAKAALIAFFFMNLRFGSPLVRVFAGGAFFWLAILIMLSLADVLTRF